MTDGQVPTAGCAVSSGGGGGGGGGEGMGSGGCGTAGRIHASYIIATALPLTNSEYRFEIWRLTTSSSAPVGGIAALPAAGGGAAPPPPPPPASVLPSRAAAQLTVQL